jgi:anaphase-promoting complex subunit 3
VIQKDTLRVEEALERFKLAEQLAPNQPMHSFRKAHTLTILERYDEALHELEKLAHHHISETNVHYLMGRIYQRLGMKKEAVRSLTLAQDRLPGKSANLIKEALGNAASYH